MNRLKVVQKILIGTVIGACVGGGLVYASQGRQDPLAKWLSLHHIGTPTGAVAGSLLGSLIGWVVAGLDRRIMAQLAEVSAKMNFELFEQPGENQIAPVRKAFHDVSFSSPRCLMTGNAGDCQVSLLDCKVFRAVGGYKGPVATTVVLLPNDEPRLSDFDLIPHEVTVPAPMNPLLAPLLACVSRWFRSAGSGGSPLERRFARYYDVRVSGRPAKLDLVHRVLSQEAVAYFAENRGWTARAHAGYLLLWDSSESECDPKRRPDLVEKALQIRRLLKQAPQINRATSEVPAAV
jgi:hypothetical protein